MRYFSLSVLCNFLSLPALIRVNTIKNVFGQSPSKKIWLKFSWTRLTVYIIKIFEQLNCIRKRWNMHTNLVKHVYSSRYFSFFHCCNILWFVILRCEYEIEYMYENTSGNLLFIFVSFWFNIFCSIMSIFSSSINWRKHHTLIGWFLSKLQEKRKEFSVIKYLTELDQGFFFLWPFILSKFLSKLGPSFLLQNNFDIV